jgi:hypothetical protein
MDNARHEGSTIMNPKVRALAIATGVVVGVTGFAGFGYPFVVVPSLLIVGALVQPYFSVVGRILMGMGGLFVTFPGLFFGYAALDTFARLPNIYDGPLLMSFLSLLSFFLVVACDLILIIDGLRLKR